MSRRSAGTSGGRVGWINNPIDCSGAAPRRQMPYGGRVGRLVSPSAAQFSGGRVAHLAGSCLNCSPTVPDQILLNFISDSFPISVVGDHNLHLVVRGTSFSPAGGGPPAIVQSAVVPNGAIAIGSSSILRPTLPNPVTAGNVLIYAVVGGGNIGRGGGFVNGKSNDPGVVWDTAGQGAWPWSSSYWWGSGLWSSGLNYFDYPTASNEVVELDIWTGGGFGYKVATGGDNDWPSVRVDCPTTLVQAGFTITNSSPIEADSMAVMLLEVSGLLTSPATYTDTFSDVFVNPIDDYTHSFVWSTDSGGDAVQPAIVTLDQLGSLAPTSVGQDKQFGDFVLLTAGVWLEEATPGEYTGSVNIDSANNGMSFTELASNNGTAPDQANWWWAGWATTR